MMDIITGRGHSARAQKKTAKKGEFLTYWAISAFGGGLFLLSTVPACTTFSMMAGFN